MVTGPGVSPLTTPVSETVATPVALLLHTPPEVASDKSVVDPSQKITGDDGEMAEGAVTTVTITVAVQLPAK